MTLNTLRTLKTTKTMNFLLVSANKFSYRKRKHTKCIKIEKNKKRSRKRAFNYDNIKGTLETLSKLHDLLSRVCIFITCIHAVHAVHV